MDDWLYNYYTRIVLDSLRPSKFILLNPRPRYTWIEKLFCKNLIRRSEELDTEIRKLKSKPVKWNRWTDLGTKRRKRRKTNANKS